MFDVRCHSSWWHKIDAQLGSPQVFIPARGEAAPRGCAGLVGFGVPWLALLKTLWDKVGPASLDILRQKMFRSDWASLIELMMNFVGIRDISTFFGSVWVGLE